MSFGVCAAVVLFGCQILLSDEGSGTEQIPIAAFAQLPLISEAQMSPDGSHVAYLRPAQGRRHLIVQKLHSPEKPVVVGPMATLEFEWLRWVSSERIVFSMSFSAQRQLTETTETRLLSIDRAGTTLVPLIKPASSRQARSRLEDHEPPPPQIQDNVVDWLEDDPDYILVALDENFDGKSVVRKINVLNGDYKIYKRGRHGVQNWVVDNNSVVRIGYGFNSSTFTLMLKAPGQKWTTPTGHDWWDAGFFPLAFSDDPAVAYVRGPGPRGLLALYKMRIMDGEFLETVFETENYQL
jgi:hypothetical protein